MNTTTEYTDTQSVIDGLLAECATGKAKSRTIWESRGKGLANGKPAEIIMLELRPAKEGCAMDTHGRIRVAARCIPGLQAKGATRHIIAEKAIGQSPHDDTLRARAHVRPFFGRICAAPEP